MTFNVIIFRAAAVVKQYPGVKVMLDHCGMPFERDPQSMKIWREGDWYLLSGGTVLFNSSISIGDTVPVQKYIYS